jgi:hypothetical protein
MTTVTTSLLETKTKIHVGISAMSIDTSGMPVADYMNGGVGNVDPNGEDTGDRPELGNITADQMAMIGKPDQHSIASCVSTALALRNWKMHIQDATTGDVPAKPWLNQLQSFQDDHSNLILAIPSSLNPDSAAGPDTQHQYHMAYAVVIYLLNEGSTDSIAKAQQLIYEMKCIASWSYFKAPHQTRGPIGGNQNAADAGDRLMDGIIMPDASYAGQRGHAWMLASHIQLYLVLREARALGISTPDDGWYEWERDACIPSNMSFLNRFFVTGTFNLAYAVPYYDLPARARPQPDRAVRVGR